MIWKYTPLVTGFTGQLESSGNSPAEGVWVHPQQVQVARQKEILLACCPPHSSLGPLLVTDITGRSLGQLKNIEALWPSKADEETSSAQASKLASLPINFLPSVWGNVENSGKTSRKMKAGCGSHAQPQLPSLGFLCSGIRVLPRSLTERTPSLSLTLSHSKYKSWSVRTLGFYFCHSDKMTDRQGPFPPLTSKPETGPCDRDQENSSFFLHRSQLHI